MTQDILIRVGCFDKNDKELITETYPQPIAEIQLSNLPTATHYLVIELFQKIKWEQTNP
jgi:hypothetical protein